MKRSPLKINIAYLLPVGVLISLVIYYPILKGVVIAFQNYNLFNTKNISFSGLENFKLVVLDQAFPFLQIVINTLVWVFLSLILQFLLGFALALLLKKPFKGRGIYTSFVFYTWAVSGFAISLIWSWIFNGQLGLMNDILLRLHIIENPIGFLSDTRFAMISVIIANVWYGIPYFGIMLLAALQSVPIELYEAAKIDGAGSFTQLLKVTIPYIWPTIISTTLLRMMWIMNFPEIIYGMTSGGPANATNILSTHMLNKIYIEFNYGQGSAIGLIIMISLFVFAFIYLSLGTRKEDRV